MSILSFQDHNPCPVPACLLSLPGLLFEPSSKMPLASLTHALCISEDLSKMQVWRAAHLPKTSRQYGCLPEVLMTWPLLYPWSQVLALPLGPPRLRFWCPAVGQLTALSPSTELGVDSSTQLSHTSVTPLRHSYVSLWDWDFQGPFSVSTGLPAWGNHK